MISRSLGLAITFSALGFAQSADFGLQAQMTIPGGNLTKQVGSGGVLGLGLQGRFALRGGHAIVARLDRVEFSGTRTSDVYGISGQGSISVVEDYRHTIVSLGADYNYYFSHRVGQGFYLGGGLGLLRKDNKCTSGNSYFFRESSNPAKTRFFVDFNMGMALNHHLNLFMRSLAFGDERKNDTSNGSFGWYQANDKISTTLAFGAEFHF